MKSLGVVLLSLIASAAAAEECFQLSTDGRTWPRTAELLCIDTPDAQSATITLRVDGPGGGSVAQFQYRLLKRARCIDCNEDQYGVASPSNGPLQALRITFDGKRDAAGQESGVVRIGATQLFYRGQRRHVTPPPGSPPPVLPPPSAPSPAPMSPEDFSMLRDRLSHAQSVPQLVQMIRGAAESSWFTAEQATQLLGHVPSYEARYAPAEALHWRIVDRANLYRFYGALRAADVERLRRDR